MNKTFGVFLMFVIVGVLALPGVLHAGFGVSPSLIRENNLVPGGTFTRTIYLVQGNPKEDSEITVTVESRDIKDWISVAPGYSFVIPKGVQQFPIEVTVDPPEDAELGSYKAFVRANKTPAAATDSGQVSVSEGVRLDVEVTVGDNIVVDYEVTSMSILDIEEGEDLQAKVVIENKGNTAAAPAGASFELYDKFGNTRLGFVSVDADQFPKVPAFSSNSVTVNFPLDLRIAQGEYWGRVAVLNDDGKKIKELNTVFNVFPRGANTETAAGLTGGATSTMTTALVAVVIILIIAIIILMRRRGRPSA